MSTARTATTALFVGLISDTHGLVRIEALAALRGARQIVHAGDVGGAPVLAALQTVAPVTAVAGNTDRGSRAPRLSATEIVEVQADDASDPLLLYVLHDLGQLDLDPAAAGIAAVISGHTHRPHVERIRGVLYVNPGAAGPRRDHRPPTVARLEIGAGKLLGAEIIELDGD